MLNEIALSDFDATLGHLQCHFPKILDSERVYYSGSVPNRDRFHLGIVGTRRPTPESRVLLEALLSGLRGQRMRVVSGGALGVDAQAHFYSLKAGIPTYSWVVGDPTSPTPHSNRHIFNLIDAAPESAILTPACLYRDRNVGLNPAFWVERNYWLAANVDAMLVVQAKEKSGTWWTVKACQDFGIPVYAFPGALTDRGYVGNNLMIANSYATAVASIPSFTAEIKQRVKEFFGYSEKIVKGEIAHGQMAFDLKIESRAP